MLDNNSLHAKIEYESNKDDGNGCKHEKHLIIPAIIITILIAGIIFCVALLKGYYIHVDAEGKELRVDLKPSEEEKAAENFLYPTSIQRVLSKDEVYAFACKQNDKAVQAIRDEINLLYLRRGYHAQYKENRSLGEKFQLKDRGYSAEKAKSLFNDIEQQNFNTLVQVRDELSE